MAVNVNSTQTGSEKYLRRDAILGAGKSLDLVSMCCWWRTSVTPLWSWAAILDISNGSDNDFLIELKNATSGMEFWHSPVTGGTLLYDSATGMSANTWYFSGFTRRQSDNSSKAYIGTEGATPTEYSMTGSGTLSASPSPPDQNLMIGWDPWNEDFAGDIAHVRVWEAFLSGAEMQAEAKSAQAVRRANLAGEYRFTSGNLTLDSSGNGRTLTAYNSPTWVADPIIRVAQPPFRRSPNRLWTR